MEAGIRDTEVRRAAALDAAGPAVYLPAVQARWLTERPEQRWSTIAGSLLFADVSGFTALGERLARLGTLGTEELTDVIRTIFAGLIDGVQELGGDLLKFGGDALLVLFDGPEHEARACKAALQMQSELRAARRLRTSAGRVSLALSAGVASGPIQLFLVGAVHRELVVCGPVTSEVYGLEGAAQPGEVRIAPRTAAAIGLPCPPDPAGLPGTLLSEAPAVASPGPPPRPAAVDAAAGLPTHLRDHVPGDGEHRQVTAAFLQYRGIDDLLERAGPDALADALDGIVSAAQEACRAHGITFVCADVDENAGKLYLISGAPTTSPDDEDRMLTALRGVVGGSWPLPVRAGANRGRAFVVDVGPSSRVSWSVMGDTVNLAARVMGKAPVGEVMATRAVLERCRDAFERTPVPPFKVKGKTEPVDAEIVGRVVERSAAPATAPAQPLLGRDRELAVLRAALARALAGGLGAVELVGEPGIGKTRLLEAALAEATGFRRVSVHGGAYTAVSPYLAVRGPLRELLGARRDDDDAALAQILRARVREVDAELEPWLPLIGIPLGLELPPTPETSALAPEFARARLHAAVTRLVDGLTSGGATLFTVEDAHWLDEASSELLGYLLREGRAPARLILVTRRDVPGGLDLSEGEGVEVLKLAPLGREAARAIVARVDPALTPAEREELVARSEGNPLFLQELLAAAEAGNRLESLPDTVEGLIASRIDALPPADRTVLRQAAVLGARVPMDVLEAMLSRPPAEAVASLGSFLEDDGEGYLRFRHALLRETAYEALPFRRRRALHAQAAELIERRPATSTHSRAQLLSLHYHAAHRWPESWRWSRLAGEHALRQSAPVEAVALLGRALEAGRALRDIDPVEVAAVAEQLGDAANFAGRYDTAAAAYGEARRRRRGDPLAEAEICRKEGRLCERAKHTAQALRWYTRGMRRLEERPEHRDAIVLRGKLTLAYAAARLRQGRLRDAIPLLESAAETARRMGDRRTLAHAYYLLDWAHTDLGSPEAHRYRDLALPIFEELGDFEGQANVLNNLGVDAYYEGRWEEAVSLWERSRVAQEKAGDIVQIATALNNVGEIRSDQGRWDEAQALFSEALATWRAARYAVGIGIAHSHLGRLASRRGDYSRARELLAQARVELERVGDQRLLMEVDAREAERLIFAHRPEAAIPVLDAVRAEAHRLGPAMIMLSLVERLAGYVKLLQGDRQGARASFGEALEYARAVDAVYEEAASLEALSVLGGPNGARQRMQAIALFARLGVVRRPPVPGAVPR